MSRGPGSGVEQREGLSVLEMAGAVVSLREEGEEEDEDEEGWSAVLVEG